MENIRAALRSAEERYKTLFDNIPGATAIYKGIDMEIVLANDTMIGFWVKDRSVIGKTLLNAVPELEEQPFIGWLQQVFLTGETFSCKEAAASFLVNGKLQTSYYDFTYRALRGSDGTVEGIIHSATDVTELVLERMKVVTVDERLTSSLQAARIGTWNFDAERDCMALDRTGRELYHIDDEGPLSFDQTLRNIHPDDIRQVYHTFIDCLQPKNEHYCDTHFRIVITGHDIRWLHCTGEAVFDKDQKICHFAGIVRDITKEIAGAEAQRKLQQQKDNFLSIASHELKTPVTSIKAYAQLLERMLNRSGDIQNANMVGRLTGQVNRLTALLDDLLDVSKISNDRLNFKRDYHVFNEIVEENIRDTDCWSGTHKVHTELEFMGNIYCDRMRIGQVISNLISNAVKYSPDGDKIIIRTVQQGTDVVFSVQDFGIGISQDNLSRVFDQFYRVSNAESYAYQGMGLGLFISAEIIRQESGKIWVNSEEKEGSAFCFSLPLGNNIR
jgi:signal transduction histidine kinase